jgi:DNA-binding IclR family transcriptional regulator
MTWAVKSVPAVHRALDVLELLQAEKSLRFSDIVDRLGLPKSSVHLLLRTLIERGYVRFSEADRSYHVGIRLWEVGRAYAPFEDLIDKALPLMKELTRDLDETSQLAVLEGDQNLYLAKVDSEHPLRLVSVVGQRLPAYATGIGKALLTGLSDVELDGLYPPGTGFKGFTPNTIVTADALKTEIRAARKRGFTVDREEYTLGVRCVAVPLTHPADHRVLAALSIAMPSVRWSERTCTRARKGLQATASKIAQLLKLDESRPASSPLAARRRHDRAAPAIVGG